MSDVLIVDESELICDRLRDFLFDLDEIEMIRVAHSIDEMICNLSECRFQIVIMDDRLVEGVCSAIQIVKRIEPESFVIMLLDNSYHLYKSRYNLMGADFFFEKSTCLTELPLILSKMLKGNIIEKY